MKEMELFLFPITAAGHLVSMVEMAARLLVHNPNLSITALVLTTPAPRIHFMGKADIQSASSSVGGSIQFEEISLSENSPLFQICTESTLVSPYLEMHKPLVKAAILRSLSSTGTAAVLIIDFMATNMMDMADELGIPTYLYFTASAATLALMLHSLILHEKKYLPVDLEDNEERDIEIPGLSPTPARSMPDFVMANMIEIYKLLLDHCRQFRVTRGMIINTFSELESSVLTAIGNGACVPDHPTPPLYPVGPVVRLQEGIKEGADRHRCIKWLDEQPSNSVVFLCFGSASIFSASQIKEMAEGLESSGHRFLWAMCEVGIQDILPEGFLERTECRGLVWPKWVPQVEILSHKAVGGFVTHCGWNSCLESLWFGVPMLAWPRHAEQFFNAFRLAREAGVVLELKFDRRNDNYVSPEELERGIRCLMEDNQEGEKVRRRAQELKVASRRAVEKGGSSYACLEQLVLELTK